MGSVSSWVFGGWWSVSDTSLGVVCKSSYGYSDPWYPSVGIVVNSIDEPQDNPHMGDNQATGGEDPDYCLLGGLKLPKLN